MSTAKQLCAECWELSSSELKASDSSCDLWSTKLHHNCCTVLHENAHLERRRDREWGDASCCAFRLKKRHIFNSHVLHP